MNRRHLAGQTKVDPIMTHEKRLEESLSRLRSEIKDLHVGDDQTKQRLERLVQDIEQTLASPKDTGARATLGERWKSSILGFEVSHPRLAGVMNEVLEALSNMGI